MTCSAGDGELAAALLTGERVEWINPHVPSPGRAALAVVYVVWCLITTGANLLKDGQRVEVLQ